MISPFAYYISDGLVEMVFLEPVDFTEGDNVRVFTNHSSNVEDVIEHNMTILIVSDDKKIIRVKEWIGIDDTYEKILFL